jgi:hypothetical protein
VKCDLSHGAERFVEACLLCGILAVVVVLVSVVVIVKGVAIDWSKGVICSLACVCCLLT